MKITWGKKNYAGSVEKYVEARITLGFLPESVE
jgi:hypothetical protein